MSRALGLLARIAAYGLLLIGLLAFAYRLGAFDTYGCLLMGPCEYAPIHPTVYHLAPVAIAIVVLATATIVEVVLRRRRMADR